MESRKFFAAVLIAAALFGANAADAQHNQAPQSQRSAVLTQYPSQASNARSMVMSFDEVKAITESSIREAVSRQLKTVDADEVNNRLAGTFEALVNGKIVSFAAPMSGTEAHTVTEQRTMNVRVVYEQRPVGGILTVRVELVPNFCGIGAASRCVAYREHSEALDNLEPEEIGRVVADLCRQLGEDYAAR